MNKHTPHCTASFLVLTLREALTGQFCRSQGCALSLTVRTASYRPLSAFFWGTRYFCTPQNWVHLQRTLRFLRLFWNSERKVKETREPTYQVPIGMGYPQVPAGGVFGTRRRPHVDNPRKKDLNYRLSGRIDSYRPLSLDSKLPLCYFIREDIG
jgi:hypothetical protein